MYRVFESLDALVTVVEEARSLPMTSNCVVPRGDVLELLDDVREALPGEVDDAQDVLDRRDEILGDAGQQAEQVRSDAATEADRLVTEAGEEARRLVGEARAQAEQTLAQASHEAERAIAEGRRQYTEAVDRARVEAERAAHAGRATYDRYVADAAAEAARLVSATEVVRVSHTEASRIVDAAETESDRLRRECDAYVDATLADFEENLTAALRTVSRGRGQLWRAGGPAPAAGRSGTGMDLVD